MNREKIVILDNVRSAHNVGSIFRTSDGAGVTRILLCGYTPAPIDRFGRVQNEIAKTSLSASSMIPWEKKESEVQIEDAIITLKREGFTIVAVEQTSQAIPLYDFMLPNKVAYVFGNEVEGVSAQLLSLSDAVVEIPMHGQKESLNVSVTAGIVLFHI